MKITVAAFVLVCFPSVLAALTWSATEVNLKYGTLEQVGTDGAEKDTTTVTLQHANGWTYGDNFLFIDYLDSDSDGNGRNPFNPGSDTNEFYGEWYSNFSLGKISQSEIGFGPVKDIGLIAGFNWGPEVDSWWFLPGVRLSLDLPGFSFANLDFTAYQHHSYARRNDSDFKILSEGDSWMVDFNWSYPFTIGKTSWSLEGHVEYIDGRTQKNTFGETELSSWILAQPQLRLDLGDLLSGTKEQLFVGIEYQYWHNKLGERGTQDNEAQLLIVWKF
jgi:nucleoside-specific outer membrane channel protein Tsx